MLGILQFALLHYHYIGSPQFAILVIPNASWWAFKGLDGLVQLPLIFRSIICPPQPFLSSRAMSDPVLFVLECSYPIKLGFNGFRGSLFLSLSMECPY